MSKPTPATCRTTIWLAGPSGKRGRPATFPDASIRACLTLKAFFGLPLRQTTGLVASLLKLAGRDWAVPDFSTLSRGQCGLSIAIRYRHSTDALHLLIDIEPASATGSSEPARGIKAEGQGARLRQAGGRTANQGVRGFSSTSGVHPLKP